MSNKVNGYNKQQLSYGYDDPAPVKYYMGRGLPGSYDGLRLKPRGDSTWRKYPNNPPLKSNPLFVPQGAGIPLRNEEIYVDIPKDSMFYFAHNYASPACCPSSFSTSTGCLCTTPGQRDFINRRGSNKVAGGNPDI